jgi:hypothetical protein
MGKTRMIPVNQIKVEPGIAEMDHLPGNKPYIRYWQARGHTNFEIPKSPIFSLPPSIKTLSGLISRWISFSFMAFPPCAMSIIISLARFSGMGVPDCSCARSTFAKLPPEVYSITTYGPMGDEFP